MSLPIGSDSKFSLNMFQNIFQMIMFVNVSSTQYFLVAATVYLLNQRLSSTEIRLQYHPLPQVLRMFRNLFTLSHSPWWKLCQLPGHQLDGWSPLSQSPSFYDDLLIIVNFFWFAKSSVRGLWNDAEWVMKKLVLNLSIWHCFSPLQILLL